MRKKKSLNKKQICMLVIVAVIVLLGVGWIIGGQLQKNNAVIRSNGNAQETESEKTITYQGKKYQYKKNLKNILFMGVDKREEVQVQEFAGRGGQSDTILLLVMDKEEKTTQILQISRDSMVNLKIYDIEGTLLAEQKGQLALQYAYGDGEKKSCRLMEDAVSELLYGIPISGYASLNMDGIVSIVNTLGGVPITFSEDYSYVDPAYAKGASVTLDGDAAERFVRYRDIELTGSNNVRMERQTEFMDAMMKAVKSYAQEDNEYDVLLDSVSPYMVTDLTAEEMKELSECKVQEPYQKVPGETVQGEVHDEYHVDDEALYELVLDIFYEETGEK